MLPGKCHRVCRREAAAVYTRSRRHLLAPALCVALCCFPRASISPHGVAQVRAVAGKTVENDPIFSSRCSADCMCGICDCASLTCKSDTLLLLWVKCHFLPWRRKTERQRGRLLSHVGSWFFLPNPFSYWWWKSLLSTPVWIDLSSVFSRNTFLYILLCVAPFMFRSIYYNSVFLIGYFKKLSNVWFRIVGIWGFTITEISLE